MNAMKRIKAVLVALACGAALTLGYGNAQAISCGDVLGPGGSYVLNDNLWDCSTNPGLTIVGPVSVDLNGHWVDCYPNPNSNCVVVLGHDAVLTNGGVGFGQVGIWLKGTGKHKVSKMQVVASTTAIQIDSDKNVLSRNTLSSNLSNPITFGFIINGDRNVLDFNTTDLVEFSGFYDLGDSNTLTKNTATRSFVGILASGSRALVSGNTANYNISRGVLVENGTRNVLKKNVAAGNFIGIELSGASKTTVSGNVATGNTYWDADDEYKCGSNKWTNNFFIATSQSCIH